MEARWPLCLNQRCQPVARTKPADEIGAKLVVV